MIVFFLILWMQGSFYAANGQCDGTAKVLSPGSGEIKSPGYPFVNGTKEKCNWAFDTAGRVGMIVLNVTDMKLYFTLDSNQTDPKIQTGNLTVQGELLDSTSDVPFCVGYYKPECEAYKHIAGCESKMLESVHLTVSYATFKGKEEEEVFGATMARGFKITYNYLNCSMEDNTTETGTGTTQNAQSTTKPATGLATGLAGSTRDTPTHVPSITYLTTSELDLASALSKNPTENSSAKLDHLATDATGGNHKGGKDFTLVIVVVAAVALLVVVSVVLVCVFHERKTRRDETTQNDAIEMTSYPDNHSEAFLAADGGAAEQPEETEATALATEGGASPNHQSDGVSETSDDKKDEQATPVYAVVKK